MIFGTTEAEAAVMSSHDVVVKCEAWVADRVVERDLPLTACGVGVDSSRFVRRQARMTFREPYSGSQSALAKVLARPGCELRVWRGVRLGASKFWWPIHWGMAYAPEVNAATGTLTLDSPDRGIRIARNRFRSPRASRAGFTVAEQIQLLLGESVYRAGFEDLSGDNTAVPNVTWERDRAETITSLARSIGCEFFMSPNGPGVLRPIPRLMQRAPYTFRAGVTLESLNTVTDWSSVFNIIEVESARTDLPPLRGTWEDDDPTSPTYTGLAGMGPNPGFYASPLFTTAGQCANAARAIGARQQGARVSVDFTSLVHPGLEAGDRSDIAATSGTHRLVLDSFELDAFAPTMSGSGRTKIAVEELS